MVKVDSRAALATCVLSVAFLAICAPGARAFQLAGAPPSAEQLAREAHIPALVIAADQDVVGACLRGAEGEVAMMACEDALSSECDESTTGAWICARRKRAAWAPALADVRARLGADAARQNQTLTEDYGGSPPDVTQSFAAAEAAWDAWVAAWCGYQTDGWYGGSGAKVVLASCYAHETARHVVALRLQETD